MNATVTFTFDKLISKLIGITYTQRYICAEFEEPRSILCLVIIWARFGLYIIKLKVTVTLTFDRLTSKSIGIIYTPRHKCLCQIEQPYINSLSSYHSDKVWSIYTNMLTVSVTMTFDSLISKSIVIIYTPIQMSVPNLTNLGQFCVLVIIRTRFALYMYINILTVIGTLTFNRLISKSIGITYTPRQMSVPNLRNLCQFHV